LDKANRGRKELAVKEKKRPDKLESIAAQMKLRENVQNRQLQTWLTEDEYAQIVLNGTRISY